MANPELTDAEYLERLGIMGRAFKELADLLTNEDVTDEHCRSSAWVILLATAKELNRLAGESDDDAA